MNAPPRRPLRMKGTWHFQGLTWRDLARLIAGRHGQPGLSDEEIDWLLWEHTAFPLVSPARVCVQLHRYFVAQEGQP